MTQEELFAQRKLFAERQKTLTPPTQNTELPENPTLRNEGFIENSQFPNRTGRPYTDLESSIQRIGNRLGFSPELPDYGLDENTPVYGGRQISREEALRMGGMAAGGLIGGGFGGVGGYGLAEIINRRLDGRPEDTTPKQVLKDLGVGALYEFGPRVVGRGVRRLIPQKLIDKLTYGSLKPSPSKGLRHAEQVTGAQKAHELTITEDGLKKAEDIVSSKVKQLTNLAKEAEARGETIDPNAMYSGMIRFKDKIKDLPPTSTTKDALEHIDKMVDAWKAKYGTKPISPVEALRIKRSADKYLTTFWRRMEKGDSALMTPLDKTLVSKGVDGIRSTLNKNPEMKQINREIGPLIKWLQDAERRVVSDRTSSLIPFGTAETIGVAKALGGNVPAATAAVGGRALLMKPGVASKVAVALQRARGKDTLTDMLLKAAKSTGRNNYPVGALGLTLTELLSSDRDRQ